MGKAQSSVIIIFVILGIAVLAGISFVMLTSEEEQTLNPKVVMNREEVDFLPFVLNTEEQMLSVIHEGIHLMGSQGGVIFEDQGGNTPRDPPYETPHLTVGIISGIDGGYQPQDLWMDFDYDPLLRDEDDVRTGANFGDEYIYGFPKPLPPLDKIDFENVDVSESIEMQLESYIKKYIPATLNYDALEETALYVDLPDKEPEVEVTIAEDDVQVVVSYPLHARQGDAELDMDEWYFVFDDFLLRRMYNFITQELIVDDMYYLTEGEESVDIISLKPKDTLLQKNDKITVYRNPGPDDESYDIINIVDNETLIDDEPFSFQFIRENRPPDVNSVKFYDENDKELLYSKWYDTFTVECPNFQRGEYMVDPDEDDKYYEGTETAPDGGFVLDWYSWDSYGVKIPVVWTIKGHQLYDFNRNCSAHRGIFYSNQAEFDQCGSHELEVVIEPTACDVGTTLVYGLKDNDDESLALTDSKKKSMVSCDAGADLNQCCTETIVAPDDHAPEWETGRGKTGGATCGEYTFCAHYGENDVVVPVYDGDGNQIDTEITQVPCCLLELVFETRCNECGGCSPDFECYEERPHTCDRAIEPPPSLPPHGSCEAVKYRVEQCT